MNVFIGLLWIAVGILLLVWYKTSGVSIVLLKDLVTLRILNYASIGDMLFLLIILLLSPVLIVGGIVLLL